MKSSSSPVSPGCCPKRAHPPCSPVISATTSALPGGTPARKKRDAATCSSSFKATSSYSTTSSSSSLPNDALHGCREGGDVANQLAAPSTIYVAVRGNSAWGLAIGPPEFPHTLVCAVKPLGVNPLGYFEFVIESGSRDMVLGLLNFCSYSVQGEGKLEVGQPTNLPFVTRFEDGQVFGMGILRLSDGKFNVILTVNGQLIESINIGSIPANIDLIPFAKLTHSSNVVHFRPCTFLFDTEMYQRQQQVLSSKKLKHISPAFARNVVRSFLLRNGYLVGFFIKN